MPQQNSGNCAGAGENRLDLSGETQRMAVVGRLALAVIHDLNNFLTVIQLNADLLEEEGGGPDGATMIREIARACSEASSLTRNMLMLARGETCRREVLDLGGFVTDLMDVLKTLVGRRARFTLEISPNPLLVEGDRSALGQAFMNLVLNAVDAESREPIQVRCFEDGDRVGIVIQDFGHGIAPAHLPHLFEPFFSTKAEGKGTGLGLHIVRQVVTSHGGDVTVESEEGRGTTFQIYLPRASVSEGAIRSAAGGHEDRTSVCRILLVEDDPGIRLIGRQILERKGYQVWEAGDPDEARRLWASHGREVDLLFTDLVLPGGSSGGDLAREFLASKPGLKILFTSGNQTATGHEPLLTESNFLAKPFRPAALTELVDACIERGS